jgi:hypothetical protein
MNSTRLALGATIATTAFWTAKAVAIGIAGGLDQSPLEGPLFFLGLLCSIVAAAATGIVVGHRRSVGGRVLSAAGGIAAAAVVMVIVNSAVDLLGLSSSGWVWAEVNLWAFMLTLLVVNLSVRSRRTSTDRPTVPTSAPLGA